MLDRIDRAAQYAQLHPSFERAFEFLRTTDLAALPPGRHEIDGDAIYLSVDHVDGRGRDGARLEAHREHIDIQVTIDGDEQIGWRPLAGCEQADGAFDASRDIGFYRDRPETWLVVPPRTFAIFFPEDAHAPLAGTGPVRKAIVKIRVRRPINAR
ncbi:MAG: YhcH/YjgK/YiaL family protein [Acidobacteriota bacterium]|nr:YhcH/YjgK/YiaL family protein [Acidobacteriota bacterium]